MNKKSRIRSCRRENHLKQNKISSCLIKNSRLAHIPEPLQESIITFIPKLGKMDYTQCKSWRPITTQLSIQKHGKSHPKTPMENKSNSASNMQ